MITVADNATTAILGRKAHLKDTRESKLHFFYFFLTRVLFRVNRGYVGCGSDRKTALARRPVPAGGDGGKVTGVPASDDEDGDEDEQQDHAADNGYQEDRGVRSVADYRRRDCETQARH